MTIDEMQKKVTELATQREQLIAQANACAGAMQVYAELIAEAQKAPPVN